MRNKSLRIAGLLASAGLFCAGCGTPKVQPNPVPAVVFPLVESARIPFNAPLVPRLEAGPDGLALAVSTAGELRALDPGSGNVRWTFSGGPSKTAPLFADGKIFWASADGTKGRVHALDAAGKVIWTRTIDGPVRGDLGFVGGYLVFRLGDESLAALRAVDGSPAWTDPASLPDEWIAGEKRIVARTAAGRLRVLDPEGRLVRDIEAGEGAAGSLGLDGDLVYLGYADGRFGALDLASGKKKWTIRLGGVPVGPPVSDGRVVLVALSNHVLAALRAGRGDLLWWKPFSGRAAFTPLPAYLSSPSKAYVFASSRSAVLQAFELADGTETIAFTAPREILAPALRVGSKLVLLTTDGEAEDRYLVLFLDLGPPKAPGQTKADEKKK